MTIVVITSEGLVMLTRRMSSRRAFSLVELLVVIGIIAVLISLLLPALQSAKRQAQTVQCAANMRSVAQALVLYTTNNRGYFPPNTADESLFWYQGPLIGKYLPSPLKPADGGVAGGVMICPADFDDSVRSYAINIFSSSLVSHFVQPGLDADPPQGRLYKFGVKSASQIILLGESWPELDAIVEGKPDAYTAEAVMGYFKSPGERFGAGNGMGWGVGRFGTRASQITWYRHRAKPTPSLTDPSGRANFAFVDGHVALVSHTEAADFSTGKSRLAVLWSLGDEALQNKVDLPIQQTAPNLPPTN